MGTSDPVSLGWLIEAHGIGFKTPVQCEMAVKCPSENVTGIIGLFNTRLYVVR